MASPADEEARVLEEICEPENWREGRAACKGCGKRKGTTRCATSRGPLCPECARHLLVEATGGKGVTRWDTGRLLHALGSDGEPVSRLAVLGHTETITQRLIREAPTSLDGFCAAVMENMGHARGLPIDETIRDLAFRATLTLGGGVVRTLCSRYQGWSWPQRVNGLIAALEVDPADHRVQRFLADALIRSDHDEARGLLLSRLRGRLQGHTLRTVETLAASQERRLARECLHLLAGRHAPKGKGSKRGGANTMAVEIAPLSPLERVIDRTYEKAALERLYAAYLRKPGEGRAVGDTPTGPPSKRSLVLRFAAVCEEKEQLASLLSRLPEPALHMAMRLAREEEAVDIGEGNEGRDDTIFDHRPSPTAAATGNAPLSSAIKSPFLVFGISRYIPYHRGTMRHRYRLFLPEALRPLFARALPAPEGYDLVPLASPDETDHTFVHGEELLTEIAVAASFVAGGNLSFKANGDIRARSLQALQDASGMASFYPDGAPPLSRMRANLAALLLSTTRLLAIEPSSDFLKGLLSGFFDNPGFEFNAFLPHIKGIGTMSRNGFHEREKEVAQSFRKLLEQLPEGEWIGYDNIFRYVTLRKLDLSPFHREALTDFLYVNEPTPPELRHPHSSGYTRVSLSRKNHDVTVIDPLLKALLFLAAAFGILDLAYASPWNRRKEAPEPEVGSVYHGIRRVRLTKLGAFVLGKREACAERAEEPTAAIRFGEERLVLTLAGEDRLKRLFLEKAR